MAEENSAGSGFGKLVYGTLKGNGINTEGMSFDEAVKKFNELGGTDNWHAKIMKREAKEKEAKESANATKNTESQNQKQIPKEFKKNEDKNHYEYGGAIIRESEYEDGLVEVSIKGHTIMASDLEDAKKTIDEFNGTESTNSQKQTEKDNRVQQIEELKQEINKLGIADSKRAELIRKKNAIEDSIKAEESLKASKEKYPIGSQIHDIYRREWLEVVGYDERTGDVKLKGNSGTISRRMNAEALDKLYDASSLNKPREKQDKAKPDQKKNERKAEQFDIIQKTNPMQDDIHTGIRSVDDIKSAKEVFEDNTEESYSYPDFTEEDGKRALKEGKIKVYSSKPIENGGFVSPSKMMAQDYAGSGKVYEQEVDINDIAWINGDEGQFAKSNQKQPSVNETPNEYKGYKIEPGQYGLLKISHPSGTFFAADYEDAKNKIEYYDKKAEQDRQVNENLKKLAQETAKRKASLTEEDKANQRKYWARRKPGKLY